MSDSKPGLITIYLQLMKLRVVILLQMTAICAIFLFLVFSAATPQTFSTSLHASHGEGTRPLRG